MEVAQKLRDTPAKLKSCIRLHATQYQTIWIILVKMIVLQLKFI